MKFSLAMLLIVLVITLYIRDHPKEIRARKKPLSCVFPDELSEEDFKDVVERSAKRIRRRIKHVSINGSLVCCYVESQSGISEWMFTLDFNDCGRITGEYECVITDNKQSSIPNRLGSLIQMEINNVLNRKS